MSLTTKTKQSTHITIASHYNNDIRMSNNEEEGSSHSISRSHFFFSDARDWVNYHRDDKRRRGDGGNDV
jgi:hypothetical protein